ncbi:MAG: PDZ domain-containing protein, partial [Paramuribaculum sp.]|nr:PDZ domain-containing protein [Paramuribaculum sp.]
MKPLYKRLSVWLPLIVAASLALGIWTGSFFFSRKSSSDSEAYAKLQAIMSQIDKNYVDTVNLDSLLERSLPALLAQLDPHSTYIPASELEMYNDDIAGSFSGIGIKFNVLTDTIAVDEVISGGPSEKVVIMAGDRIVEIDDSIVAGRNWSNERIIKSLRGPKDTTVKLGIKRNNSDELLTFTVTRGDIPVNSVDASYIIAPGIGYIKLSKFTDESYKEFLTSLARLRAQGAKKYIFDLRGNGGGLMQAAVQMANEFLGAESTIVSMKGK